MKRTLIRNATIITMDAQGDLPHGDILVTGDTLTAIAAAIDVQDTRDVQEIGRAHD